MNTVNEDSDDEDDIAVATPVPPPGVAGLDKAIAKMVGAEATSTPGASSSAGPAPGSTPGASSSAGPVPAKSLHTVATCVLRVAGGTITYHHDQLRFRAFCLNPLHGSCILTRYAKATSNMGGRPVCQMISWLAMSHVDTHEEHFVEWENCCADEEELADIQRETAKDTDGLAMLKAQLGGYDE